VLTNRWQKVFAWTPAKRLGTYAPPFEKSEPLSWQVLIAVLLVFSLVVSPAALKSFPVLFSILILAGLGAVNAKVRALGLGLIGIPALLALLFQGGAATDKSWAALLAMLEFYALVQLIWGLEEETPQPWRATALLWFLMPSALGLLGILLLMLLANAKWQASLLLSRVAKIQSLSRHWIFIVLSLILIAFISTFLPLPKSQGLTPPSLPTLLFSSGTKNLAPNQTPAPDVFSVTTNQSQVPDSKSTNWIGGFGVVLIFMVVYFFYVQRMLRYNVPARVGKPKQSNQIWLWLGLFMLTGAVLVYILFGLTNPKNPLQVQLDSSGNMWLALLFFLVLFVLWRIQKSKRGLVKSEKSPSHDSDLEKLRYLAPQDAIRAAYFRWLVLLRDLEIRRSPTQTPLEFQGLVRILHPQLEAQTQILTEAYQRVRYGTTPSLDELEVVLAALLVWQGHVATILPLDVTPQMVSSAS
jgi:hypothetical protein